MPTTMLEQETLKKEQLRQAILNFAKGRDTGFLGTTGPAGLRVSPVKYFMDDDLNIYIHSKGGSKFHNLSSNGEVCLLVSSPFKDNFHQIKGVQFFGTAQVVESNSGLYSRAEELCPWRHDYDVKLIYLPCDRAIYVDRISREDIKQEWKR